MNSLIMAVVFHHQHYSDADQLLGFTCERVIHEEVVAYFDARDDHYADDQYETYFRDIASLAVGLARPGNVFRQNAMQIAMRVIARQMRDDGFSVDDEEQWCAKMLDVNPSNDESIDVAADLISERWFCHGFDIGQAFQDVRHWFQATYPVYYGLMEGEL